MKFLLSELAQWAGGRLCGPDAQACAVSTDNRKIVPGAVFFALRGERFDGHDFVAGAAAAGAVCAVVDHPVGADIAQIVVGDVKQAFGAAAAAWRSRFDVPMVTVAGSNGKTTTTQMIASILAAAYGEDGRLATRGNFNNDIGVPITLWRLESAHRAAVVEAGMNHPGEMAYLAGLIRPTVALVNNAQREHQEFMASVEATAVENSAVIAALPEDGIACFPADDACAGIWAQIAGPRRRITWARRGAADITARWTLGPDSTRICMATPAGTVEATLSIAGEHNVHNAMGAAAAACALGLPAATIARGLEAFRPVARRGVRTRLACGALLIDESYNANPDSMRAAIDVLASLGAETILVAGDMGEIGGDSPACHREIGAYCAARGVGQLLCLGKEMAAAAAVCPGARHFDSAEALVEALRPMLTDRSVVLVKGSNFMKLDRIVAALAEAR